MQVTVSNSKIKICHICDRITGRADGIFTHLLMILRNLDRQNFEQSVIFQGGDIVEYELKELGIKFYKIPELSKKFSIRGTLNVKEILKQNRVEILHVHSLKQYIIIGILNIFLKKKLIYNYHGLFIESVYHGFLAKKILYMMHTFICYAKAIDVAITPSITSKKILEKESKIFPSVKTYYNSIDDFNEEQIENSFINKILDLKRKYLIVGIVARLDFEKRIDIALMILHQLKIRNLKIYFLFFGDGPLEKDMIKIANQLNIMDMLEFLGYVKNAKTCYKLFDVLLLTSDSEGFPLSIWEAMASGVPIVATDVGGVKEIIESENCGFIFPRGDVASAVEIILKLADNILLRKKLGQNGKNAIQTKYNKHQFIHFFENLYSDLHSELK